jgi:hypothetical protein
MPRGTQVWTLLLLMGACAAPRLAPAEDASGTDTTEPPQLLAASDDEQSGASNDRGSLQLFNDGHL